MRDRLRPFTRWPFLVVLVVAIVLSFVQPAVFLGVLLGLAVALLCALLPYGPLGRRTRAVLAGVALVVVLIVVLAVALSSSSKHSQLPPTGKIQLGTTLETTGHYISKQKSLDTTDRLTIAAAELTKTVNSPLLSPSSRRGLTEQKVTSALTTGLRNEGWQTTTTARGVTATRKRSFQVKQHSVVPGVSENQLLIAPPTKLVAAVRSASGVQALPISFTILKGSVVFDGPRYAIATTKPSSHPQSMPNGRESRTVALAPTTQQVTYDVRSEAFRNAALAKLTDVTKWGPFPWLVALVVALSNGAVRDRIARLAKRGSRAEAKA